MNKEINDKVFDLFPRLESERLIFRDFKKSDAKDLFLMRSNDRVMHFMDLDKHKTIHDSGTLINEIHKSFEEKSGIIWAIIEKSIKTLIGRVARIFSNRTRLRVACVVRPCVHSFEFPMSENKSTCVTDDEIYTHDIVYCNV